METPDGSISAEDLVYLGDNEGVLRRCDNQARPTCKELGQLAGMQNEGSTCYLNSVLQCLLQCTDFSNNSMLLEASPNALTSAVQQLFSQLLFAQNGVQKSTELINAVGWTNEQRHQQHDAHELYSLLIEAIGGIDNPSSRTFYGQEEVFLQCPDCGFRQAREANWNCLSLDLPSSCIDSAQSLTSLAELLPQVNAEEVLDIDNRWTCSGCRLPVCARKGSKLTTTPAHLTIQLKRFAYDLNNMQRIKLQTGVVIPLRLDMSSLVHGGDSDRTHSYVLTGVTYHLGTAMGGHYRALVQPPDTEDWFDCDDARVTRVSRDTMAAWLRGDEFSLDSDTQSSDVNASQPQQQPQNLGKASKSSTLVENAYILFYSHEPRRSAVTRDMLPEHVQQSIIQQDDELARMMRVYHLRQRVCLCHIVYGADVHFFLFHPLDASLQALQEVVLRRPELAHAATMLSLSNHDGHHVRLRKSNQTYGGQEQQTLRALRFAATETVYLDLRISDSDPEFTEFHPDDCQLDVQHIQWSDGENEVGAVWDTMTVCGRAQATIGDLSHAVQLKYQHQPGSSRLVMTYPHHVSRLCEAVPVDDATQQTVELRTSRFHIQRGDRILIVDYNNNSSGDSDSDSCNAWREKAVTHFHNMLSRITLLYNDPRSASDTASSSASSDHAHVDPYVHRVLVPSTWTLRQLHHRLSELLQLSSSSSLSEAFHLRRGAQAPQWKDVDVTLHDVGLCELSQVHLQLGAGCAPGEHLVRLEWMIPKPKPWEKLKVSSSTSSAQPGSEDSMNNNSSNSNSSSSKVKAAVKPSASSSIVFLRDLNVSESASVLSLKKRLFSEWQLLIAPHVPSTSASTVICPQSEHHIRLCDLKGGKASAPLRNDRSLGKCLLGLADGRRLGLQVLHMPEMPQAEDWFLSVKVFSTRYQCLYDGDELCISRRATWRELCQRLLQHCVEFHPAPENDGSEVVAEEVLSVVKAFASGPPLTFKSAEQLKWPAHPLSAELLDRSLAEAPWNLRDGALIVVKSMVSATGSDAATGEAAAAGNGASAVRVRRPLSRAAAAAGAAAGGRGARRPEPVLRFRSTPTPTTTAADQDGESEVTLSVCDQQLPPSPMKHHVSNAGEVEVQPPTANLIDSNENEGA